MEKTPFLIGKSSISMGHLYHGYVKKPEGTWIRTRVSVDAVTVDFEGPPCHATEFTWGLLGEKILMGGLINPYS